MRASPRKFITVSCIVLVSAVTSALIAPHTAKGADGPASLKQCFNFNDITNWIAPNTHTLFLRVAADRYYRVDLSHECSPLHWPDARLITRNVGSQLICSPVDFNLRAAAAPGDVTEPCFVHDIIPLSPNEMAALPRGSKP
jgi:hypothetical protein